MSNETTLFDEAEAQAECPPGMAIVTEEEFFWFIHVDPRDIMPTTEDRNFSVWRTTRDRHVVGRTLPGWGGGRQDRVYMLTDEARRTLASSTPVSPAGASRG
jgi:hypothetical protein